MNTEMTPSATTTTSTKVTKVVYTVVERGGPDARSFWMRVGSAWVNRDGSLTVRLDALPVNGTLQVRDPDPRDAAPAGGAR